MVDSREHMMQEMVTKGGEHNGLAEVAPGVRGLVHVPGGVEHVQAPVTISPKLVSCMVELWSMVGGSLLYNQHVAGHTVHGQPEGD